MQWVFNLKKPQTHSVKYAQVHTHMVRDLVLLLWFVNDRLPHIFQD